MIKFSAVPPAGQTRFPSNSSHDVPTVATVKIIVEAASLHASVGHAKEHAHGSAASG